MSKLLSPKVLVPAAIVVVVLIVENLRGLARIPAARGNYAFLPLKLKGVDGAPVRAVFLGS